MKSKATELTNESDPQNYPHCPYLGLKNDPSTSLGYPSESNVCHHSKRQATPRINYQESTCLTKNYSDCPLYKAPQRIKMPRKIRGKSRKIHFSINILIKVIIGVGILTVIFLAIRYNNLWLPKVDDFLTPSWQKTQQDPSYGILPTREATLTPMATETLQPTLTRTPTQTPTKEPTITRIPSTLAMDVPIGRNYQFIIHRALPGESPGQYASEYNTTVDAFWAVNYDTPTVLIENRVFIIPVNIIDTTGLPAFEAYEIKQAGMDPISLAEKLSVDPEQLSIYNNVPADYRFNPGEWILVPREPIAP